MARPGSGPLFDLGVYCVNAARYLFRTDPVEVHGVTVEHPGDPRFEHCEESVAATFRYADDRVASFVASFGAADRAHYEVIGTEGMGFMYQMLQFQEERLFGAATNIESLTNVIAETTEYARANILVQSGTAMLAQANQMPQSVLRLLQ